MPLVDKAVNEHKLGSCNIPLQRNATLASYQAALQAISFSNSTENPVIFDRNISIAVTNTTFNTTSNASLSTIHIAAIDDGPAADIAPASYSATEQLALTLKGTGLSVSDIDAGSGSITVEISVGEGVLNVTAGGSGATVAGSGSSSVTINGTVSQINALLG